MTVATTAPETVQKSQEVRLVESCKVSDTQAKNKWKAVASIYKDNRSKLLFLPEDTPGSDEMSVVDQKEHCKAINKAFCDHMTTKAGMIVPEYGMNRSGKRMKLRKDDGTIKWSTWLGSSRMMQHLSEVSKLIFLTSSVDSVFDAKGNMKSRPAILKEIKDLTKVDKDTDDSGEEDEKSPETTEESSETAYQSILRALESATAKLPELTDDTEAQVIAGVCQKLYTDAMEIYTTLVSKAA